MGIVTQLMTGWLGGGHIVLKQPETPNDTGHKFSRVIPEWLYPRLAHYGHDY